MLQFAVNLSMMFTEVPFLERFPAARAAGFTAVEVQYPYKWQQRDIKRALEKNQQQLVLFNVPAGDRAAGECGIAADPRRQKEFQDGVHTALAWAVELGVIRLNCPAGKKVDHCSEQEQLETLVSNLRYAASAFDARGVRLMVEPLNCYDVPGILLDTVPKALNVIEQVAMPNVFLQYDTYHAQRSGGELAGTLQRHLARIGHIQIADNPGRHQPGTGEINYQFLLREFERVGYQGFVSLEYSPDPDTEAALAWLKEWNLIK